VGKTWGTFIAKGLGIAVLYGVAYLALRYISFNQWFLPAGLRAACLLFLPYRYWAFVFLGEAGITLSKKIEMIDDYGAMWAYFSSLLMAPLFAIAPLLIRRQLGTGKKLVRWLPLLAVLMAVWSSSCNIGLNYILNGPRSLVTVENATRYITGDCLGILMVVLPVLLWQKRGPLLRKATLPALIGAVVVGATLLLLKGDHELSGLSRLLLMLAMILPALFLTYFHGWTGAALGVLVVNVAIAQSLDYTGMPGAHDQIAFYAQICLVFSAIGLLAFGGRMTNHYDTARRAGIAEQEALKLSRISFMSNEPAVRDQLIIMASMQVQMDDARDLLAKDLRANGKHREAMELHRRGMEHRQLFELQALVVYPIGIERDGLFGVLDSAAFRESRASGVEVDFTFGRIDPRTLSEDLQVSAYRCVCHAIDHLLDWEPSRYRLRLRVWHGRIRRGLYLSAIIATKYERHATPHGESASLLLEARVKAHGGILRRSSHRIRLLLSESAEEPPALQELPRAE